MRSTPSYLPVNHVSDSLGALSIIKASAPPGATDRKHQIIHLVARVLLLDEFWI